MAGTTWLRRSVEPCPGGDRVAVGEDPNVGRDTGVIKHVERQGDDCLQPVVLDDPSADVALTLSRIAGEKGTAVMNLGDATAKRRVLLHLGKLVGKKQHLAVAGSGDQRILRIAAVFDHETRVAHFLLSAHAVEIGLPALSVGGIGEHEVEFAGGEGVVG